MSIMKVRGREEMGKKTEKQRENREKQCKEVYSRELSEVE